MKKFFITLTAIVAMAFCANAQTNIQEMFDINRNHLTTTLEMFKADDWGSTFFFTDIYHPDKLSGPTGYYTEIARALNFWKRSNLAPLSAHIEWNGGQYANNAWLFGAEYFLHSRDFKNTVTFELLFKSISGQKALDAMDPAVRPYDKVSNVPLQFTVVWGCSDIFGVEGLMFSGFADFWWENYAWVDNNGNVEKTSVVFISEPQIWYNIGQLFNCPNLNIGGEIEFAYNFAGGWRSDLEFHKNKGLTIAPATGIKWVF